MDLFSDFGSGWMTVWGAGLLAFGLWLGWRRAGLWIGGERVTGEIARWSEEPSRSKPWRVYWHPIVRFPARGEVREFRSATCGFPKLWPAGSRVPIKYLACDPKRAEIAVPLHFWAAPGGVVLFGLALIAGAAKAAAS